MTRVQWFRAMGFSIRHPGLPMDYVWELARVPHPSDRPQPPPE